jgi:PAS domain S-box-containing protein
MNKQDLNNNGGLLSTALNNISSIKNSYTGGSVTETITNGFFTVDNKWNVTYWNKSAEKLLGVAAKDILGKNLWEEFAGILPLEFYAVYYKAFLQDIPIHFEEYWGEMGTWFDVITYYCDDTLSVSFKSSNQPYPQYQEEPVQRLKILTELYRFVTEVTNDCLWEWNLQTKEIFWIDGGHKKVFGYKVENALIPQAFWESRLHPDDKDRILAGLHKTLTEATSAVWEDQYRFKKVDGTYVYVHDRGHIIYDKDNIAGRMIGATKDITDKIFLENKVIEERLKKQRDITDAVITAQDKERAYVQQQLNENLNQILCAIKLYLQLANTYVDERELYLEKSFGYVGDVIEEIRKISKTLAVPSMIIGLLESIRVLVMDFIAIHPMKLSFISNDFDEIGVNEKLQLNIFRILQEQLINIHKHAKATSAVIDLSRNKNIITLVIADNGIGCDITKTEQGVGIRNIISRAQLYNGSVTILSEPKKGYEMKVVLSFEPVAKRI